LTRRLIMDLICIVIIKTEYSIVSGLVCHKHCVDAKARDGKIGGSESGARREFDKQVLASQRC
jgi:hypothetical protein